MLSSNESAVLRIRLTPRGGRDALLRHEDVTLHARVSAPPVDGAANRALIDLISRTLGIAKSRIELVSGQSSRDKVLRITGVSHEELAARIDSALVR